MCVCTPIKISGGRIGRAGRNRTLELHVKLTQLLWAWPQPHNVSSNPECDCFALLTPDLLFVLVLVAVLQLLSCPSWSGLWFWCVGVDLVLRLWQEHCWFWYGWQWKVTGQFNCGHFSLDVCRRIISDHLTSTMTVFIKSYWWNYGLNSSSVVHATLELL